MTGREKVGGGTLMNVCVEMGMTPALVRGEAYEVELVGCREEDEEE